jgi:hypothetical protein
MTEYLIQRAPNGGWWLYYKGVNQKTGDSVWWHVYRDKYYAVYNSIDDLCNRLKEMKEE